MSQMVDDEMTSSEAAEDVEFPLRVLATRLPRFHRHTPPSGTQKYLDGILVTRVSRYESYVNTA